MKNVGKTGKITRIVIGVILFSLLFVLEGDIRFIGLFGAVPFFTGLANYCPLYKKLGISTIRDKK